MMRKMVVGITVIAVIAAGFICLCMWLISGAGSTYYYAQIDNRKIERTSSRGGVIDLHGGMDYSYTLPACDEDGAKKDITFGTSRELKEGAFIRLTVMPVRGVLEWSEVPYDELPSAVQSNFAVPANE